MQQARNQRQVVLISLITAVCLLGDSMLYIVMPVHYKEMGLNSLWEVGILLSVNRFVRLPLNPLAGWFYRHVRLRTGISLAVVLAAVTTASYGLLDGFWLLLIVRCVWGMAWTLLRLGAFFTILDLSDETTRGHFMGTYNGLYRLGSLFGMLLGGILADRLGVDAIALGFAAAAVAALPVVLRTVSSARMESKAAAAPLPATVFTYWRERTVWWTLVSGLTVALVYQGMFTATLSHVIESYHGPLILAGATLGAASLSGILQAARWGWEPWLAPWFGRRSDRPAGRRSMFILALGISAVLFALVPVPLPFWLWIAVLLGIQLTATVLTTVMDALAADSASGSASSRIGVMTAYSVATDLGAALGPVLGYLSESLLGTTGMYLLAAALLALTAIRWHFPWPDARDGAREAAT